MNIQLLYSIDDPDSKWIVWKRNIGKKYFGKMCTFSDLLLEDMLHGKKSNEKVKGYIDTLSYDSHQNDGDNERFWHGNSKILASDTFRNFTFNEYIALSEILRKSKMRYNKKKDQFIKIE
jgi:hypothetical protein